MEEGMEQSIDKREQSLQVLKNIFSHINGTVITTVAIWICGLYIIFLIRDFASFGFTLFQNLSICFFLILMVFIMVIAMHQTMIYQKLKEIGGVKR